MDKEVLEALNQYIDACELVEEAEKAIKAIKRHRKTVVQGVVKGSSREFPYTEQSFHIEGVQYSVVQEPRSLEWEERVLEQRKERAAEIKRRAEGFLSDVPPRMLRIIQYRVFQRLPWEAVAAKMGRRATAESVKKEYQRYIGDN